MRGRYIYKRPVRRSYYSKFRSYLFTTIFVAAIAGGIGYLIYSTLKAPQSSSPVSAVENVQISDNQRTFTNDYFEFKDAGSWVVDKNNTSAQKVVYHKFRKNVLEAEMIVYINQSPIPLYVEVPRTLPVRIVNNNSFQTTNISSPCVGQYAKGELHKVKEVSINNATMLCDPDSPQYYVILAEIGGDYRLHLKRPNGAPIQFVLTYKDLGLDPQPNSLLNIAGSFITR